jgi:hypothetical protein
MIFSYEINKKKDKIKIELNSIKICSYHCRRSEIQFTDESVGILS